METTNNTHELFLHIAEYLDALTQKDIKGAEAYAKHCAERGGTVSQARYEQLFLNNIRTYKIDDHPRSKYIRIKATDSNDCSYAHAFIDRETGSVYKPAGWKAPAKGKDGKPSERYNLFDALSREELIEHCEFSGGYLYKDFKPT